jgi:hypothetical protein
MVPTCPDLFEAKLAMSGFLEKWAAEDTGRPEPYRPESALPFAEDPKAAYGDHEVDQARSEIGGLFAAAYRRLREARGTEADRADSPVDSRLAIPAGPSVHEGGRQDP